MTGNLYAQFEARFLAHTAVAALRMDGRPDWTYGELQRQASRAAGALVAFGVAPGDRVVVQTPKSAEAVALYLACLKAGAVHVPLNPAYPPEEAQYFLEDAEPALFVADAGAVGAATAAISTTKPPMATLEADGRGTFQDAAAAAAPLEDTVPRAPDDLASIVYTSGTTGLPKGAMLTHANLASNAATLTTEWGFTSADTQLHALPIFHVHGLFVALHCAFLSGSGTAFLPGFDADACLRWLPRCTVMMGVPTLYTRLLARDGLTRALCARMRLFVSGSAPLAEATFAAFAERTGHRILERYGMSETLMNTSNPLHGERVAGTVGFPLPGVQVRVVTAPGAPAGETGEIEIKGPNVFKGYWGQPEKTAAEFCPDGFFKSGDMGRLDADGRLSIVGRAKDLIISGGYNVIPKEVERLIDAMPEVDQCAVIGVPHPDFGEAVVAVVRPKAFGGPVTLASVDAALAGRIARFKQPKQVVCVMELPRNALGKVQKNVLRERFAGLFEAAPSASGRGA